MYAVTLTQVSGLHWFFLDFSCLAVVVVVFSMHLFVLSFHRYLTKADKKGKLNCKVASLILAACHDVVCYDAKRLIENLFY